MFEISVILRDAQGRIIRDGEGRIKRKSFQADSAYKLWEFWNRNSTFNRRKKKGSAAKNTKDIKNAINDVEQYAKEVTQRKRGDIGDGES